MIERTNLLVIMEKDTKYILEMYCRVNEKLSKLL